MADATEVAVAVAVEGGTKEANKIAEEAREQRLQQFKYEIEKLALISEGREVTTRAHDDRKKKTLEILDACFQSTQRAANEDPSIAEKNAVIAEQVEKREEKKRKEAQNKKDAVVFAILSEQKGKEEVAKLEASGVSLGEAKKKVEAIVAHSYILTAEAANRDPATAKKNQEIADQKRTFEEVNGIVPKKKEVQKPTGGEDKKTSHIDPTKRAVEKPKKKSKPIVVEKTEKSCAQEAALESHLAITVIQEIFKSPPMLAFAFLGATLVVSSVTSIFR